MPTAGPLRIHRASSVSDAVPRRISHAGAGELRVLSVYRSVVNITTPDGLLTVASPEEGGLPNGILADLGPDWHALGLRPGMVVSASDRDVLVPDARLEIQFDTARRWSPQFRRPARSVDVATARWRRRRAAAGRTAEAHASADDSLGTLKAARPIVVALTAALETGDRSTAAAMAASLVGLGPGLTPSGDDVLVGIEAALHALAHPSAGFTTLAMGGVEERTTAVAATLLRHAAAGEFAERLHTLLAALLGPDDATIPAAINRAVAWGATSGADCLVGVLIGLDVAAGVRGALA